eukprot:Em0002g787a
MDSDRSDGNDECDGSDGNDKCDRSDGNDECDRNDGNDECDRSDGNDECDRSDGNDECDRSDGSDEIDRSDGSDECEGNDESDRSDGSDESDRSDGSDESDRSDNYDDLTDLVLLPKRVRQSTHSGEVERDSDIALSPDHQIEEHGAEKLQSMQQTPARELKGRLTSMIGRLEDGTLASCIIVQGIPGVGNSTLAWQLGRRWGKKEILQHFQLVIVLRLRDERMQKAHTISELLYHPDPDIQQSVSKWMASTLGEDVLLILDGYDELSSKLQIGDQSIFARIIKGKELPKLTVLVTSRPSANRNLYQLCRIREKCQYIEVVGFSKKKIREYVELAFKHNLQLKDGFNLYIKQRPHIRSMMYVPINCAIVVELFREHKGKPPQTLTEVYTALTNTLLQRHEQKTKEKTPVGMPHTVSHELQVLKKHYSDLVGTIQDPAGQAGSLYSRGMICQSVRDKVQERVDLTIKEKARVLINAVEARVTTDPSMFQVFMEVLKEEPSLSTIVERMSVSTVTSSKMTCFKALSSTTLSQLQSVARLAYQGTLNDQLIFHDVQDNIEPLGLLQKVPHMFSTSSPKASYNFIHKTLQEFLTAWYVSSRPTSEQRVFMKDSLTEPNMAMTVRFMAGLTKFQTSSENMDALADIVISLETTDTQRLIENLHWMFETQNPTFIQRLMGNKEQTFKCSGTVLNPFDLHVLGYCIANSFTLWSVNLYRCDLTDECMRMLILVEDGKAFDHITSFDLTCSTITASMASLLGLMLKENNTLKKLNLWECKLQPEELEEVIKGVQVNTKLETLVLSGKTIDNKRASCLGMMLKENNTLKKLNLRGCELQPEGLEVVIKGVQVNTKLETLVLSRNTIDNKRASCLGMMLKENNTLKKLDLKECDLQPEGLKEVIKGVQVNTMLETLDLHYYTIDNETASCLVETRQVVVIVLRLVIVEEYQVRLKKTAESKHKVVPRLIAGY